MTSVPDLLGWLLVAFVAVTWIVLAVVAEKQAGTISELQRELSVHTNGEPSPESNQFPINPYA